MKQTKTAFELEKEETNENHTTHVRDLNTAHEEEVEALKQEKQSAEEEWDKTKISLQKEMEGLKNKENDLKQV